MDLVRIGEFEAVQINEGAQLRVFQNYIIINVI